MGIGDGKNTPNAGAEAVLVKISAGLLDYLPAALIRLGYLNPTLNFEIVGEGVLVSGPSRKLDIEGDVLHAVYREKVYQDTLPMRRSLLEKLMRR